MARHNDFGKEGERLAQRYLIEHNYEIIHTDWRVGHYDIDIIARDGQEIVFVEVKTRSSNAFGEPEAWVDGRKQRSYIRLANKFVLEHQIHDEVRFDIISVVMNAAGHHIHHFIRAFSTIG